MYNIPFLTYNNLLNNSIKKINSIFSFLYKILDYKNKNNYFLGNLKWILFNHKWIKIFINYKDYLTGIKILINILSNKK